MSHTGFSNPPRNCALCPRLHSFIQKNRKTFPDKHNAPVPSFGALESELLIVGLAPGLRGANFTGRPFTGDSAGDTLYHTLAQFGFMQGDYARHVKDGIVLKNCRITNAVRCVPPENKPTGKEISTCLNFLKDEIAAMPRLKVIVALGLVAHNAVLRVLGEKRTDCKFSHGAQHETGTVTLIDSYHCSRYNMNTRRLTQEMFDDVFRQVSARMISGQNHLRGSGAR